VLRFGKRFFEKMLKSTKHQAPSSRETPNTKLQAHREMGGFLVFGIWSFFGAWSLVLGAWILDLGSYS
jgi:hypothetical protein